MRRVSPALLKIWLWDSFQFSACANQAIAFSVNGSSTQNGLFQTINGLLEMASSTVTLCIVPFKNRKFWTFCELLAISNFFRYVKIYPTWTSFWVFRFLPLLQLLEWVSRYMCGYNFTMNFPPDFHNYTGLNGLVNSFFWFAITSPNKLILGCKPHWSLKMKKTTTTATILCKKRLLRGALQKSFSKNYTKFAEKYLCYGLFLIPLKASRPSGLQR